MALYGEDPYSTTGRTRGAEARILTRGASILLLAFFAACAAPREGARDSSADEPTHVGRVACEKCHPSQSSMWKRSHHDLAMQEANAETVLGDFSDETFEYRGVTSRFFRRDGKSFVRTDGPDGELADFEIAFTFGVEPLQQYLVALPGGRYQALSLAWDSRPLSQGGQKWFHLQPDDPVDHRHPLHWTRRFYNWNLMCAECHSTGLEKNYDLARNRYDTRFAEIDVSCEACHGPGSRHVAWAEKAEGSREKEPGLILGLRDDDGGIWEMNLETGLSRRKPPRSRRIEIETCGRCHARRSPQHSKYVPGGPLLDTHRVALLEDDLYFADGQIRDEVYEYGSFLQSRMYREGVTCKDCHDPHHLGIRAEGNAVCASCHLREKFDARSHHFHEPGSESARCVACHMPQRTYMVVDPRRDHSLRVPRPDLSEETGAPNACNDCHRDRSFTWAADAIARWYGHEPREHYGEALHAGRQGSPGAGAALIRLARDREIPAIVRATALSLLERRPSADLEWVLREALSDDEPLVRLGALRSAEALPSGSRHSVVYPLLRVPVRSIRFEAARALAALPREIFTTDQRLELEEATSEYRASLLANADWPESHLELAALHLSRGDRAGARKAYESALAIDPLFAQSYVNLADLDRMESRDREAEALLRQGLGTLPEDAALHYALGLALVRLSRTQEAIAELARAAELAPEEPQYAYVYGVALHDSGRVEEAIRALEAAAERHPYDPDLLLALLSFHRDRGAISRALEYGRRLIELAPSDPAYRTLLAELEAARERSRVQESRGPRQLVR